MKREKITEKDKYFSSRPNIYAFLIDKGATHELAESAQQFITEHWLDACTKHEDLLEQECESIKEKIQEKADKYIESLDDLLSEYFD